MISFPKIFSFLTGRILNRFSQDLGTVDETLPVRSFDVILVSGELIWKGKSYEKSGVIFFSPQ